MRLYLNDLTRLVAVLMVSVVVASPATAGGLQELKPFIAPVVFDAASVADSPCTTRPLFTLTPGIRTQPLATFRVPALQISSGLGVRVGFRF